MKLKRWHRVLLVAVSSVVLLVGIAVFSVNKIAKSRGVTEVKVPHKSIIASHMTPTPDYIDSYSCPIPEGTIRDIGQFGPPGDWVMVGTTDRERVYRGRAPGLVFHFSILLDRTTEPTSITVSTVVHYTSWVGRIYFAFVRPVHRAGVPFMVSQMAR